MPEPTPKTTVLLYEDNRHLRDSLYLLLNGSESFCCAGAFGDTRQVLTHIEKLQPGVILMDIELPFMNGIETTRIVKQHYPDLPVLMLTVFDGHEKIFQSLCAGGSGYMLKTANPEQLLQALADVLQGGSPLTPSVARKMVHFFRNNMPERNPGFRLTAKETELLQHMIDGKSYKMSAEAMGVSPETIKSHVKNIYRKLHVNNSTEAVAVALRHRII